MKYNDNDFIKRYEQKTENLKHKKELLSNAKPNMNEVIDHRKFVENEDKKSIRKMQRKVNALHSENCKKDKEIKRLNDSIKSLKEELFLERNRVQEVNKIYEDFTLRVNSLEKEIQQQNDLIRKLQSEPIRVNNESRDSEYLAQIKSLSDQINSLKDVHREKILNLIENIDNLRKKISKKSIEIRELTVINHKLVKLNGDLERQNEFRANRKKGLVFFLVSDIRKMTIKFLKKLNRKTTIKKSVILNNNFESKVVELYGYIDKEEDIVLFTDLHGNKYSIINEDKDYELLTPAKATLEEGSRKVKIVSIYQSNKHANTSNNSEKKNYNKKKSNHTYVGDFSVLLVGGRIAYVRALSECGLNVSVYDSFKESHNILIGESKRAEIIIVFSDNCKHSIWHHIKREDPRVQEMYTTNIDAIIARIRYTAISLGLISFNFNG
ncbi:hypothetical protein F4V43_01990 [Paenibacillus spiritus]|uniref:DUF2325 domain-containing protein n=1 Tax=Paenibacillus spiritus TaxID=2496557 RepID=A0A5J5GGZ2_9BACL|nr:hypothetical protein [Paenibacillus spiritus]KAA9007280.1 hypothetical protein F4V43_01990 [Paenibacillus spiritus]